MKYIHILLLVSCFSFISASNKTNTLLVGDWKLIQFKIPNKPEWDVNVWGPEEVTYSFVEQGSYEFRYDTTFLQKGTWKASDKTLHLKNIINVVDSSFVNYETIFFYGSTSQKKQIIKLEQNDLILGTSLPVKGYGIILGTAYFKRQY
jgi:hypothetical protein